MPGAFERKLEVENKLENELNNLNLLKERAAKSSQLTSSMVGILDSFELRLARLEETILPVYNETGNLQRQQENIERTLAALDTVIGFYGASAEVEATVRAGPGPISAGGAGLDAFLRAMARLEAAHQHFDKNNPQSVELENVTTLFTAGGDALNREFKELLFKHSKPMSPAALLDLVALEDGEDAPASLLPRFPPEVSAVLSRLADWLERNGRDEFMNVFARVRATALLKAMTQLRDHQRSASGGSQHGSSPMPRAKFPNRHEPASKRTTRRLAHVFEKQANKMLVKASQTLEQSTGLTLGSRRSNFGEGRDEAVDEQETETYLEGALALHRLMLGERRLMAGIVPAQHQHQVFQIIVKDAMDLVVQDGESIASRAKRSIARHDFAAVLVVFPVLKHLRLMAPEFDRALDGCDAALKSKFTSVLATLQATGAKALEDFIESVRSDPVSQLPRDGTVHELTSNALVFLAQLLDYSDVIASVLVQDPAYSSASKPGATLGLYIKKVLSQLSLTLLSKSESYSDVHLRAVFRLNNSNYVLKALQRSGLMDTLKEAEPLAEENYHATILEHKKAYSNSWSRVLSHICAVDEPTLAHALAQGKLRDKERAIIKERFAGFNRELDELVRVQRGYCVPDANLRESLKRDNKDYILPKYSAFRDRLANVNFSKNPDKYVKHSPAEVGAKIDQFFDVAA